MSARLAGRVAIVTGAARGIGLAAAAALAGEGARVALADIDGQVAADAAARLGAPPGQLLPVGADVADPASCRDMAEAVLEAWGRLDILVNNAAIKDSAAIGDITPEHWRHVLAVNLDSVLHATQAALGALRRSPFASVVNVASIQGIRGQPASAPYATAKGGVVNLTRCMAIDLGPQGIRVNAVAPGFIDTRMAVMDDGTHEHETAEFRDVFLKYGRMPLRRAGTPEDIAGPVLFLASDDSRYVTGQVLAVDGGLTCTY